MLLPQNVQFLPNYIRCSMLLVYPKFKGLANCYNFFTNPSQLWTTALLALTVSLLCYKAYLDLFDRKNLSLFLIAFVGIIITSALFVRQFNGQLIFSRTVFITMLLTVFYL